MKIASFNINNVNRRLKNLLGWLREAAPDVVCLQELKAADAEFPAKALSEAGYEAAWRGQKSWNGVAILSRSAPIVTRAELPGDAADQQSRYLEAAVNGVLIASIYAPNGNPQPGPKFDYKLAWMERLAAHAADLLAHGVPVVLTGDFNVVPADIDIYPTKSWNRDALLQPASRAAYAKLVSQGWTDAVRALHPDAPMFTFWDYKFNRWQTDHGLRLDHILMSPAAAERLAETGVDRETRGEDGASDHAPVWAKLREAEPRRSAAGRRAKVLSAPKASSSKEASPKKQPAAKPNAPDAPLLVIDGDNFAHRSYHALPKTIRRGDGKGGGAIVGFANVLLRLYDEERPRAIVVGWDTLSAPTKRNEMFPAYQSGRAFDDELVEQLNVLPEFVAACGFANAKAAGFEADDFLASAVAAESLAGGRTVIASGDRDAFQLVSERATLIFPLGAGKFARIGPDEVRERYGVEPKQVPDFIALRGDPSDKLPGAAGVGPKRAASLVRRYGDLEAILDAGFFASEATMLRLFRTIATMDRSAALPPLTDQTPTWERAADLARKWGLKALADRLAERA
jgi:exodeoxyribonuclease III